MLPELPIDAILPQLLRTLKDHPALILTAPPGSGKTTRVPPALMKALPGRILLLQPRRAAARLVARRMAAELGERVGERIGYQVRFDRKIGPKTRVEVLTEGVLVRRLQSDPFLEGVSAVLLDEFHERSLQADMSLALLREVQRDVRDDLKVLLLSATLDPAPLLEFFDGSAAHLHSEGRTFPVDIHYQATPSQVDPRDHVVQCIRDVVQGPLTGHVLVFFPGVREIRRCQQALAETVSIPVFPLYGRLPPADQDAALAPSKQPKIVLSTNLAETSVTLPGVQWVIDTGLHRVATQRDGATRLSTEWISQDSADQRSGRAGRTESGQAIRLWSAFTHQRLPPARIPEIERTDLCDIILQLFTWGSHPDTFLWLTSPPASPLNQAFTTLHQIGALKDNKLTPIGRTLSALPIHPRWGRVLLHAKEHGQLAAAAALAVLTVEDNPFAREGLSTLESIERVLQNQCPKRHRSAVSQLLRVLKHDHTNTGAINRQQLAASFMAGFPDRVGQLRPDRQRVLLASGSEAWLRPGEGAAGAFLVALDLHTMEKGKTYISGFLEIQAHDLPKTQEKVHRMVDQRVQAFQEERVGAIVLKSHNTSVEPAMASEILLRAALANPERALKPNPKTTRALQRVQFFGRSNPCPIQSWEDLLPSLCLGRSSFKELQQIDLITALHQALPWDVQRALQTQAPEVWRLPSGSHARIEYPKDGPPVLTARIQQLFGMTKTPRIGGEPILVHLTAPNNRPQQQTRDLASFWRESYPQIRKELRGRYPKHAWPEQPTEEDAQDRPQRKKR